MIKRIFLASATILLSANAAAWDGIIDGKIDVIEIASPSANYGFRIYFKNRPKMCGNNFDWAYVNDEPNSNYKAYATAAFLAKIDQTDLSIYTTADAGTGFCKIGDMIFR